MIIIIDGMYRKCPNQSFDFVVISQLLFKELRPIEMRKITAKILLYEFEIHT